MSDYQKYLKESGHPQRLVDLAREIKQLREMIWLMHGHKGIYGDDGEMQCQECMNKYGFWDWKRTSIEEIQTKIETYNIKQYSKIKRRN